jgi:Uma2 family endonuclease
MTAITANFNDDQFCRSNPDVKFERNVKGEIIITSPRGGETGNRNIEISRRGTIHRALNTLG